MSSVSDEAADSKQRLNWLLLLTLACVAAAASMAFEMWAASDKSIGGQVLIWVIASAFVLKAIGLLGRWLLTKSRGRIFLLGRLPFAIGFTKLTALAVMAILILFLVLGLVAGPPYRETALRAFVFGLVASAVLLMVANALLDTIVVVRHFRGTLATTSRVQ